MLIILQMHLINLTFSLLNQHLNYSYLPIIYLELNFVIKLQDLYELIIYNFLLF